MMPDRVVQYFEFDHTFRTIWTDGRKLPADPPEPHWLGWNVGHWEGNTFVIESNGYDERSWLNSSNPDGGYPHSDQMKITERYTRTNYGTLEAQMTIDDAKALTKPWVATKRYRRLPAGTRVYDYGCSENNRNPITEAGQTLTLGTDGKPIDRIIKK